MTEWDRRGLLWLSLKESGIKTREIASHVGLAMRTVRESIQRARELRDHLKLQLHAFDPDNADRIKLLLWRWDGVCIHGLPKGDGTWLCLKCHATNHPEHKAFQRGDPVGGIVTTEHQPKGKPKSRLASPSEPPKLQRRPRRRSAT